MYYYRDLLVPCHNQSIFIRYLKEDKEPYIFPPPPQQLHASMDQAHVSELIYSMVNSLNKKAAHHPKSDRPAFDITLDNDAEPSVILSKISKYKRPKRRGKCPRLAPRDESPFKRINYIDRSKSLHQLKYSATKPVHRPKKPAASQKGAKVEKTKETIDHAEPFLSDTGHLPDRHQAEDSVQLPDACLLNHSREEATDFPAPSSIEDVSGISDDQIKEVEVEETFVPLEEDTPENDEPIIPESPEPELEADDYDTLIEDPVHNETVDSEQNAEESELTAEFDHVSDEPYTTAEYVETAGYHSLDTDLDGIHEHENAIIPDDILDGVLTEADETTEEIMRDDAGIVYESYHEDNIPSTGTVEPVDHFIDEVTFEESEVTNEYKSLTDGTEELAYSPLEDELVEEPDGQSDDLNRGEALIDTEEVIDHSIMEEEADDPLADESDRLHNGAASPDKKEAGPKVDDFQEETPAGQEDHFDTLPIDTIQEQEESLDDHTAETETNTTDYEQDGTTGEEIEIVEPVIEEIPEEKIVSNYESGSLIQDTLSVQTEETVGDSAVQPSPEKTERSQESYLEFIPPIEENEEPESSPEVVSEEKMDPDLGFDSLSEDTSSNQMEEIVEDSADHHLSEETDRSEESELEFIHPDISTETEDHLPVETDTVSDFEQDFSSDNSTSDEEEESDTTLERISEEKTIIEEEFDNHIEDTPSVQHEETIDGEPADQHTLEETDSSEESELEFIHPGISAETEDHHPVETDTAIDFEQDLSADNSTSDEEEESDTTLERISKEKTIIKEGSDYHIEDTPFVQYEEPVVAEPVDQHTQEETDSSEESELEFIDPDTSDDTEETEGHLPVEIETDTAIEFEQDFSSDSIIQDEEESDTALESISEEKTLIEEESDNHIEGTPSVQYEEEVAAEPAEDEEDEPADQHTQEETDSSVESDLEFNHPDASADTEETADPTPGETEMSTITALEQDLPPAAITPDEVEESDRTDAEFQEENLIFEDESQNEDTPSVQTAELVVDSTEQPKQEETITKNDDEELDGDSPSVAHKERIEEITEEEPDVTPAQDAAVHSSTPVQPAETQEKAPAQPSNHKNKTTDSTHSSESEGKENAGETVSPAANDEVVEESYTTILNKHFTLGDKINVYAGSKLLDKQGTFLAAGRDFFIWIDGDGYVRLQVISGGISIAQKKRKK
ncbi:hypothetical protein [Bacillus sp. Marseille-Q1617]|uniref:hypothetical protein n=1 Tax=Bacillus sp. Marseille-Q1617 TaxID=2736887 RepID=UPI00158B4832|nr:hypothetical protein [Bacillus sp. Marseille-Q1617]